MIDCNQCRHAASSTGSHPTTQWQVLVKFDINALVSPQGFQIRLDCYTCGIHARLQWKPATITYNFSDAHARVILQGEYYFIPGKVNCKPKNIKPTTNVGHCSRRKSSSRF